jgi:hypothetical protein
MCRFLVEEVRLLHALLIESGHLNRLYIQVGCDFDGIKDKTGRTAREICIGKGEDTSHAHNQKPNMYRDRKGHARKDASINTRTHLRTCNCMAMLMQVVT